MDTINAVTKTVETQINTVLGNPYIMAVLKLSLALYAAQMAPRLPSVASDLLKNTFVKMFALFLIIYLSQRDFQLAVIIAVVYVLGMNLMSGRNMLESFSDYSAQYNASGDLKLIEPRTAIYPGCEKVTMADLEKAFDGDALKLQTTVQYSFQDLLAKAQGKQAKENLLKIAYATGLPYNVDLSKEENAPLVATILMYHGFNLGGKCVAPQ